jgi:heptosyltransferase-3
MLLRRSVAAGDRIHRVRQILRLAEAIGVAPVAEVVPPAPLAPPLALPDSYAVIHAAPMFRYKRWTADGWRALAAVLSRRGLKVVATGGPSPQERAYLDGVFGGADVLRADGLLDWRQLAGLLSRARLYVGPDTSVTHLAAATGVPAVALYGPTDPVLWGPWPVNDPHGDWSPAGTIQRRGNVWLVQNQLPCVPCQLEGCERGLRSYSRCLDAMPLDSVLAAVDQALAESAK